MLVPLLVISKPVIEASETLFHAKLKYLNQPITISQEFLICLGSLSMQLSNQWFLNWLDFLKTPHNQVKLYGSYIRYHLLVLYLIPKTYKKLMKFLTRQQNIKKSIKQSNQVKSYKYVQDKQHHV